MSETFFSKTDLFVGGTGGYTKYRIPGLIVTKKGTVLGFCEARKGEGSDWAAIDILLRRSFDHGKTWSSPVRIMNYARYGDGPINNCTMIADQQTGAVHVLYCYNYARAFYMQSDDDGETFSEPVEITETFERFRPDYDWGVLAIGPDHGIQLKRGRLIAPVWLSSSKTKAHLPNRCAVIYSDDHGENWQRGEMIPDVVPNCNETTAVELTDGSVLFNIRNGASVKRRLISISPDGIRDWSVPQLDPALVEPTCQASLCRFSNADRSRVLFSNPDNLEGQVGKSHVDVRKRKNLSVKLSYDDCKTWTVSKVLEAGPSGYSALATCLDKAILCLFESGKHAEDNYDARLVLARFNLEWMTDNQGEVNT